MTLCWDKRIASQIQFECRQGKRSPMAEKEIGKKKGNQSECVHAVTEDSSSLRSFDSMLYILSEDMKTCGEMSTEVHHGRNEKLCPLDRWAEFTQQVYELCVSNLQFLKSEAAY